MAIISQTVPNYLRGISQQPDHEKEPGFLSDIRNGFPDVVYGMRKRPGAKFEYSFTPPTDPLDLHDVSGLVL